MTVLYAPPAETRQQIQQEILGDYPTRRTAAVDRDWWGLDRRTRRRTSHEQLAAAYDDAHLLICGTCALVYPQPEANETISDRCAHCDGTLLDWPERATIASLADRLHVIRDRLGCDKGRGD